MNNQSTKPVGGSNCHLGGASRFHASQLPVQNTTMRKNPIVPTRSVIQQASLSIKPRLLAASLLTFLNRLRRFRNSASERGGPIVLQSILLIGATAMECFRVRKVRIDRLSA